MLLLLLLFEIITEPIDTRERQDKPESNFSSLQYRNTRMPSELSTLQRTRVHKTHLWHVVGSLVRHIFPQPWHDALLKRWESIYYFLQSHRNLAHPGSPSVSFPVYASGWLCSASLLISGFAKKMISREVISINTLCLLCNRTLISQERLASKCCPRELTSLYLWIQMRCVDVIQSTC